MIIEHSHTVETNLENSIDFTVSADSAKIFSLLSNFLYKSKERAVITELSSNALDAHVEAGVKHLPIEVVIPTVLCPIISIRDFGNGLSEEDVYKFLTKFGESSKGLTNDQFGNFGVGSKSPAAVTDTWNITSHHNGVASEYLIHIKSTGVPTINKLYSRPSDESGLLVSIPVKPESIYIWKAEIQNVYEFYPITPTIKGNFSVVKREFELSYSDLYKVLSIFKSNENRIQVLMNNRTYSISSTGINSCNVFGNYNSIVLPFNTGELSVSLSREELQFDSRTISNINTRIKDIENLLKDKWVKEVSVFSELFSYQKAASEFKEKYSVSGYFCKDCAFNGKDKFVNIVDFNNLTRYTVQLTKEEFDMSYAIVGDKTYNLSPSRYNKCPVRLDFAYSSQLHTISFTSESDSDVIFVIKDIHHNLSRVKLLASYNKSKTYILLCKEWAALIPNEFTKILASSLDKVPVKPRAKKSSVVSDVYMRDGKKFVKRELSELISSILPNVCIKFKNATSQDSIASEFDRKFFNEFKSEYDIVKLIFIKEDTIVPSGTITSEEFVNSYYDNLLKSKHNMSLSRNLDEYDRLSAYYILGYVLKHSNFDDFPDTTAIKEYEKMIECAKSLKFDLQIDKMCDIMHRCERLLNKPLTSFIADGMSKLYLAYPLLKMLRNQSHYTNDDIGVVEYMKLCNR